MSVSTPWVTTPSAIAFKDEGEKALQGKRSGSQETIPETNTLRGKRMAGDVSYLPPPLFSHSVENASEELTRLPGDFRA